MAEIPEKEYSTYTGTYTDKYMFDNKYFRVSNAFAGGVLIFIFIGGIVLFFLWGLFLNQWLGTTTVGSMWAKNNFDTQYYVFIQPENATSKNYRVKGDISRTDGEYSLNKIYWENGGYLTFTDCKLEENNGIYTSVDDCQSSNWLNDDDGYEYYNVRIDQKVLPQKIVR